MANILILLYTLEGMSSRENSSENMDIQHKINSWCINKESKDDYIQTRKGGIKLKKPVAHTPNTNKRNNCSIRRDEMPLTETQLAHDDLDEAAVPSNTLESKNITNIQKEHLCARLTEQVSSVCTCTSVCE